MYKQNLNIKPFICLALIISTCFSSISLFENTDSRNMIAYEIGALRDIESRMYEEEIIDHKSNFSYFSLLVGINGKHEIKAKLSSLDNDITGISPYVKGELFSIGYSYYFIENNTIPVGFNLKLDIGVGLNATYHHVLPNDSGRDCLEHCLQFIDAGFGIFKKINLDNYNIYPRIELYNRNITYVFASTEHIKVKDQIIEIHIPLKLEVPALEGVISNKGMWISPNLIINDKDIYSGASFGLYHKF